MGVIKEDQLINVNECYINKKEQIICSLFCIQFPTLLVISGLQLRTEQYTSYCDEIDQEIAAPRVSPEAV
ncbi:hypothetical protein AB9M62_10575 [Bacillales bacterium AN1005]